MDIATIDKPKKKQRKTSYIHKKKESKNLGQSIVPLHHDGAFQNVVDSINNRLVASLRLSSAFKRKARNILIFFYCVWPVCCKLQ